MRFESILKTDRGSELPLYVCVVVNYEGVCSVSCEECLWVSCESGVGCVYCVTRGY